MDIIIDAKVAYFDPDANVMLLNISGTSTGPDETRKIRPGQKVKMILEQRVGKKAGKTNGTK